MDTTQGARSSPVIADLQVRLSQPGGDSLDLGARLAYHPADPYAVTAAFHAGDGDVVWVFARDLLRDGLADRVGHGDVRVEPAGTRVLLTLSSPDGYARLALPTAGLTNFVRRMYDAVPGGSEIRHLDLDAAVAALGS